QFTRQGDICSNQGPDAMTSNLRHPQQHDELLNYRLKRLFTMGGAPAVRLCEGSFGLPRFEWRVVAALVERGAVSPSQLSARVGMDAGRVSRAIGGLVEKKLVVRYRQPGDRRRATVSATDSGRRLYAELFPRLAEINSRLVNVLTDSELNLLDRYLNKLTQHARKILDH